MVVQLISRRPRPARWIARWLLGFAIALTLAGDASASSPQHSGEQTGATHAEIPR
jgi:hypothetical protein